MMLAINMIIVWSGLDDTVTPQLDRILYLTDTQVVLIDIDPENDQALPRIYDYGKLLIVLAEGEAYLHTEDPRMVYIGDEATLPEKRRAERDRRYALIQELVVPMQPDMFVPVERSRRLRELETKTGVTRKTLLKYLRRYWQGGMIPNALLSHYTRSGAPGKRRSSDKKLGRPDRLSKTLGHSVGVNLTDVDRENFETGLRRFYERARRAGAKVTLKQAYQRTLETFYVSHHEKVDGVSVPVLLPITERPTFHQFHKFYYLEWNYQRRKRAQSGDHGWNLHYRGVADGADQRVTAPGAVYQIDATVGDVYLVSALETGRIIGRPVIYLVTDVFSRMIVGFSVSLEGPSWAGAMLALENVATDKVAYCAQFGINIQPEAWPSHHLPQAIVADRGEMESHDADNLLNILGISEVVNLPPYRPDWKGLVESQFNVLNQVLIHWLPGAVYQPYERGGKDYRLDAKLTLDDFRQLMIRSILYYNQHRRLRRIIPDPEMVADGVEPYPVQLWRWGIAKRSGVLRVMDPHYVRLGLLPRRKASVTEHGIRFDGLYYDCETARREDWYAQARQRRWSVTVAYDPRAAGVIYYCPDKGEEPERCTLLSVNDWLTQLSWWEVQDYLEREKQRAMLALEHEQAAMAQFNAHVDTIVNAAEDPDRNLPNAVRLQGIRENRAREKGYERAQDMPPAMSPAPDQPEKLSGYIPAPQDVEFLRRIQNQFWDERLSGEDEEASS